MPSFLFRLISFFRQMTSSILKFPKMNVSNKNYIIAQSSMDMNLKLNQLSVTILTKLTIYSNQWKNIMVTALTDFTRYVLLFEWTYDTSKYLSKHLSSSNIKRCQMRASNNWRIWCNQRLVQVKMLRNPCIYMYITCSTNSKNSRSNIDNGECSL